MVWLAIVQIRMIMQTRYEKQSLKFKKTQILKGGLKKIPADRIPVESDRMLCGKSTNSNNKSDVKNC